MTDILQRAKDMIVKPKETWAVIDGETATVQTLYIPYVLALAAIGPLAHLIGGQVFGYHFLAITVHPPLGAAIASALLSYVLTLIGVYVVALVIDALAPTFGGQKNPIQALKVAVYSATAGWVAGVFAVVPALKILGLLGLYSLYLLYLGLPRLMKAPEDKAVAYTVVVVVVAAILYLIIAAIVGAMAMQQSSALAGSVSLR